MVIVFVKSFKYNIEFRNLKLEIARINESEEINWAERPKTTIDLLGQQGCDYLACHLICLIIGCQTKNL